MSASEIVSLIKSAGVSAFSGYASTGSKAPYVAVRPLISDPGDLALNGMPVGHDTRYSAYCVGASVDASFNLAKLVVLAVQGKRVAGEMASCSLGYSGALIESRYETQVTIQLNQGELT